ncbi:MAG: sigma-70 family RNA polymerase sigma factor [Kiritimatiellae bacterium]|nr:sigma-70 family RNA polymerase sigma factor [Kiritimatiellia bacterium]
MIPNTPQTLLRKIAEHANGDDAAEWERCVELYTPVIRQFVSEKGRQKKADVDDMVQDIFVRLVEVLREKAYRSEKGRFRTYLATMVRHLLIDRYRRALVRGAEREVSLDGSCASLVGGDDDVVVQIDLRLRFARHAAAVEHVLGKTMLDPRTVAAYREYALNEEPATEVAARHGLTLNALRQIKFRVNKMIAALEASL